MGITEVLKELINPNKKMYYINKTMLYFLVTASLFNECEIRKGQYKKFISHLHTVIEKNSISDYKIVIIENNGHRSTFLDDIGEVFYTNNNSIKTKNKGIKELHDILDCINKYNIQDDDFIIKLTGRYILHDDSEFMKSLKDSSKYDAILKYGSFIKPVNYKMEDCITGLIGMKCSYVKLIQMPSHVECVEWKWAKFTYLINDDRILKVNKLGIDICPGSNTYYGV